MRDEIEQIEPQHVDKINLEDEKLYTHPLVCQRKYDGERVLVHFLNGKTYVTSRHISKETEKFTELQDKLINLPILNDIGYTVLDCECYGKNWAEAASILHSLPERALELQKHIHLNFAVFDVLYLGGNNLMTDPYETRMSFIQPLLNKLQSKYFHITESYPVTSSEEILTIANNYWNQDLEGVVVKKLDSEYRDKNAMLKLKKQETIDAIVCGKTQGTGKNTDLIGALEVGYYENGKIIKISKVNCGTDESRKYWTENFDKLVNKTVIEVKCQEITKKSLRHPSYLRIRDDKNIEDCTKETIFK